MKSTISLVIVHLKMHVKRLHAECDALKKRPGNSSLVGDYETIIAEVNDTILRMEAFKGIVGPAEDIMALMLKRQDIQHIIVNISAKGYNPDEADVFSAVATHEFCSGNAQPLERESVDGEKFHVERVH